MASALLSLEARPLHRVVLSCAAKVFRGAMPIGSFARLLVCAALIVLRRSGAKLSLTLALLSLESHPLHRVVLPCAAKAFRGAMPNGSFARLLVCAALILLRRSGAKLSLTLLIA